MKRLLTSVLVFVFLFLFPVKAMATWSIVAVDPKTGEVGSAGASHTPAVWVIAGIAPGHGVIAAQAETNETARIEGVKMLMEGKSPEEVLQRITSNDFDKRGAFQQYGIASLNSGARAYTGASCSMWAGHFTDEHVSVQGNILTDEAVAKKAFEAYKKAEAENLPMAERLLAALEAGSEEGGDARAGSATAMTSYLVVAKPNDKPNSASFGIIVPPGKKGENPVKKLRIRYEELKGIKNEVKLPSMNSFWLIFAGVPVITGLIIGLILSLDRKKLKFKHSIVKKLLLITAVPLVLYYVLVKAAQLTHWVIPVYGMYSWILPLGITVICLALTGLVKAAFWIVHILRLKMSL